MKIRRKNDITMGMVKSFEERGLKDKKPIWRAIAKELNRPRRVRFEVNLSRINSYANEKETVVVPGVVLGAGSIEKAVSVAALRFSGAAKERIEKAGGKCLSLNDLTEKDLKGKIRIMG
jgi:large subunit ribosomal protein L18e